MWVDRVARHGAAGIEAVSGWAYDDDLAPFAFEVIVRAAQLGTVAEAWAALKDIEHRQLSHEHFAQLVRATDKVDALPRVEPPTAAKAGVLTQLVAGQIYRRRDELHAAGLGADLFHGISYAVGGDHALLFSGSHGKDFGYADTWKDGLYHYYGEWRGDGDMRMTGGNAAIADRSPYLYLFTEVERSRYRFEGRFKYVDHRTEPTERDGAIRLAIIFRLRRVADTVDLHQDRQ